MPAGAQPDSAVHDPLNICNCLGGQYCRHTGLASELGNREIGYCVASSLAGTACNTTDQCRGPREDSTDGGAARREVGFCVGGKCAQCNPDTFAGEMGSSQHVCPGYTLLANNRRVYHNSMPGVVVSCSVDGMLITSGQPNFELKAGNAPPDPEPSVAPSPKKDDEPSYVLGLLITIFVVMLVIGILVAGVAAMIWRIRARGGRIPPPVRLNE